MISSLNNMLGQTYMSIEKQSRPVKKGIQVTEDSETQASQTSSFDQVLQNAAKKTYSQTELDQYFEAASKKYNVSLELLKAVAKAESDFNPNCVSSAGAVGVMQLMPATAKELGVSNSYDAEENIMGGAKYLARKLKEYNGNVELALAAYNAGSGAVNKYGGIPPYKETQNYVKKIMGYLENGF